jgi:phage terminase small subunit
MPWQELTEKQRAFVREYLVDLNATQAYLRAGYTAATKRVAETGGSRMLRIAEIAAEVAAAMEERGKRTKVTADRVLLELERLAFFDPVDLVDVTCPADIKRLPPAVRRCIVGWDWKGKNATRFVLKLNKEYALTLLAQHHGLTKATVELPTGVGSVTLNFVPAKPPPPAAPPAKGK